MSAVLNPPAFPSEQHECQDGSWNQTYCDGMSLRDWFAGQSIPAVLDTYSEWQLKVWFGQRAALTREEIRARAAYALADAMLAERARATNTTNEG